MPSLSESIKKLYGENISDAETILAQDRILGYFKLLQKIESRLSTESKFKDKSNEEIYENNRSSN